MTLRLEKATEEQALEALSRETGIPLQIDMGAGKDARRADLSWSKASLERVFADLDTAYGIRAFEYDHGGYRFARYSRPPGVVQKEEPTVEAEPQISVKRSLLTVTRHYKSRKDGPDQFLGRSARLQLELDAPNPSELSRESSIRASDAGGWEYLAPLSTRTSFRFRYSRQGWNATTDLGWLGKGTQKLQKVTVSLPKDEVTIWRQEFTLPLAPETSEKSAGEVSVEVALAGRVPEAEREVLRADDKSWMVHSNIRSSDHVSAETLNRTPWIAPIARGASGRYYWPWAVRRAGRNQVPGRLSTLAVYNDIAEPIQSLIYRFAEVRPGVTGTTLQLGDIDLPAEEFWEQSVDGALPPGTIPEGQESKRPFLAARGGTLVLQGLPVSARTQVGLQQRVGMGWSGIRWAPVDADRAGVARYPSLKAGRYRVTVATRGVKRPPVEVLVRDGAESALKVRSP